MDLPLISVIVPVYNLEKDLQACVQSIRNQTYSKLEIILIDDGSTDSSGSICDELRNVDERIVVLHQKNQGVSAARNTGIKAARGQYIGFIDGDDYIAPDMYETMANELQNNVAIVQCRMERLYPNGGRKTVQVNTGKFVLKSSCEYMTAMQKNQVFASCCDKLFKAEYVKNAEFNLSMRKYEDELYNYAIVSQMERNHDIAVLIPYVGYTYYMRETSVTHGGFNEKSFDGLKLIDSLRILFSDNGEMQKPIAQRELEITVTLVDLIAKHKIYNEKLAELQKRIRKALKSRCGANKTAFIKAAVIALSPKLYCKRKFRNE